MYFKSFVSVNTADLSLLIALEGVEVCKPAGMCMCWRPDKNPHMCVVKQGVFLSAWVFMPSTTLCAENRRKQERVVCFSTRY